MKRNLIPIATLLTALALPLAAQDADPFGPGGGTTPKKDPDPFGGGPAKPRTVPADPNDPFGPQVPAPPPITTEPSPQDRDDLSLKYEVFSLDLATAAALGRKDLTDVALYETVIAMVSEKKAVQEILTVMRTRSRQRSTSESILEYIYPTEWDPAELPNSIGVKIDSPKDAQGRSTGAAPDLAALDEAERVEDLPQFVTPATPTSFETRNLGFTFQCDPIRGADRGIIEARIAPEHVSVANLSTWGEGVSALRMPEVESQRLSTSVMLVIDLPRLIGTINQPPVSKVNPKAKNVVWLAFLTASNVK